MPWELKATIYIAMFLGMEWSGYHYQRGVKAIKKHLAQLEGVA